MRQRSRESPRLSHAEFTALVDRHQHALYAYLSGIIGHAEPAFDLTQETFYEAWRSAELGTPPFVPGAADDEVRRWLFRAGSNNAISLLRRRKLIRWESLERVEEPLLAAPNTFEEHIAEGEALQAALGRLAPQDVACLLLRVVYGFSASEAGEMLNTSAENVNNRLARAKQRLRAAYGQLQPRQWEVRTP
jgi:RNA polymerase sigma-70 factor (ECF subfamily)